ncbi:MAG: phosphatase PAP2 family protein [Comamonadaceae bacterium]|nr:MAG: phosphatase PAP2 family protein [Comamonadaceae bacterium]
MTQRAGWLESRNSLIAALSPSALPGLTCLCHTRWSRSAPMEALNLSLFNLLGAGFAPDAFWLGVARVTTPASVWAIVVLLAGAVLKRPGRAWDIVLGLLCAGCVAVMAHALAAWLDSPRPFMAGLSPLYVAHGARGGLPSTHASVMTALAVFLMLRPRLRPLGLVAAALMAATAWARMYLGLHFPVDIAGGFVLGALSGAVTATAASAITRLVSTSRRNRRTFDAVALQRVGNEA